MATSAYLQPIHHLQSVQPSYLAHNLLWNQNSDQLILHEMLLISFPNPLVDQFPQPSVLHPQFSHIHPFNCRTVEVIPLDLDPKQYSRQFSPPNSAPLSPPSPLALVDQYLKVQHPT